MQDKNFIRSIFRNGPSDLQIRKPAILLSGNGANRIIFLYTPITTVFMGSDHGTFKLFFIGSDHSIIPVNGGLLKNGFMVSYVRAAGTRCPDYSPCFVYNFFRNVYFFFMGSDPRSPGFKVKSRLKLQIQILKHFKI